jgi:RNA polymerase sigma-70 factor (ECF subfamily)
MGDDPRQPPADVAQWIRRAQVGDQEAVGLLYQEYAQRVYRYIVYRVAGSVEAEDLTAEVFVKMVEGLSSYRVTGAPFEAWLYRIAAARVADHYRRTQRRPQTELSESMTDSQPLPEDQVLQAQEVAALRAALHTLTDEQQTVLILRFIERKSHEEVAEIVGKHVNTVRSIQHRALTRLSAALGASGKARHYLRGDDV